MKRNYEFILIFCIFLFLLIIRFLLFFTTRPEFEVGQHVNFTHRFLEAPKDNGFGQYFFWNNILISLPQDSDYKYGDAVSVKGVVERSVSSSNNGLTERLIIKNPEVKEKEKEGFLAILSFVRQRALRVYASVLPAKEAGLLSGIVIGAEEGIGEEFKDQLKTTGMLHVVVASGSNVVLVAGVVFASLTRILNRRAAIVATIFAIVFYAFLTGFDSPIVRASIMASFAFGAQIFGRQRVGFASLLFAGFVMLFVSPNLLFDIGFQLSLSATAGILLFQSVIAQIASLVPQIIKEDFVTSVSAQIGSLPFMMGSFGEYNMLSLGVNLLLLWTIPFLMIFGGIAGVVGLLFPLLAVPFLLLSYPLLLFFETVVSFTSNFALPLYSNSIFMPLVILYYLLLFVWLTRRRLHSRIEK